MKAALVEGKQVDLAEQIIRAIARKAEAERERRAKVIHAEGEYVAAEKLAMAAAVIQQQPAAIQLRCLQTLVEIGAEHNTTIVFPSPIDLITSMTQVLNVRSELRLRSHEGSRVKPRREIDAEGSEKRKVHVRCSWSEGAEYHMGSARRQTA